MAKNPYNLTMIFNKLALFSIFLTIASISVTPYPEMLVISYLLHELGHMFFARVVGAKMKKIKIGTLHLSLSYDPSKISYLKEMIICFGGIIFNIISALIFLALPIKGEGRDFFIICNFSLAIMNLYPASILDGGGILRCFLKMTLPYQISEKISRGVSVFAIILLWLLCVYFQLVFVSNLSLFIISIILLVETCFSFVDY